MPSSASTNTVTPECPPSTQEHKTTNLVELLSKPAILQKYDLSGPRYTSYPTAPHFNSNFGDSHWKDATQLGNQKLSPLSLYFHIPFCDTICYYCGCNKIVTADKSKAIPYLTALISEMDIVAPYINANRTVEQLHFGGGTPTYFNDEQLTTLMHAIKQRFHLLDSNDADFSIEVHPAGVTPQRIKHLRNIGFNRLSMGIQDFSPEVQTAVNRFNSQEEVEALVSTARSCGFKSISMDLIYGLPNQTQASFASTLNTIIALNPDRISLFNYAHMPHLFKTQKQIDARALPEPQEKLRILQNSIQTLCDAGYHYIGMDHFAKHNDSLAQAQQQGKLHRNFQGYTTHGNCDLFAFGVSAISSIGDTYSQNAKNLTDYYAAIHSNKLPIQKGVALFTDDVIRRDVINQLLCNFELDYAAMEKKFGIDVEQYFEDAITHMQELEKDGLVTITKKSIKVKPAGRLLIRRICMAFDYYASQIQTTTQPQYSRIL